MEPPLGRTSHKKNRFISGIAQNDVFARITEPSNDDYDNDVSDNCDNNFGTFDDFGVKNDQKVSHNMILMSKYKGQHGGKKGQKIRARPSPPPFRAMPERNRFFLWEVFPYLHYRHHRSVMVGNWNLNPKLLQ